MPLRVTASTIAKCLRTDCNIVRDNNIKKSRMVHRVITCLLKANALAVGIRVSVGISVSVGIRVSVAEWFIM
jgi:hypothetical protein